MQITINLPAIDRLCDLIESGKIIPFAPATAAPVQTKAEPTPAPEPKADKPAKVAKPAKAAKPEPTPEPEVETPEVVDETEHTVESITASARKLIAMSSPAVLRHLLDGIIGKGVKIGEAKGKDFPKLAKAIEDAITERQAD